MTKIIVANQKNVLKYPDVIEFLKNIRGKIPIENVIFCPSYPYLLDYIREGYVVGSQDVSESGERITGEINASILSSLSVKYSLVGHTERRINKKETEEEVIKKIKKLVENRIHPLFCIGEMFDETFDDVSKRLQNTFQKLSSKERDNIFVCYEPMDAIETNKDIISNEIEEKIKIMKKIISSKYNIEIKVLYGGSVDSENIKEILSIPNLDGVLLGSSSIKSNEFLKIIEVAVTM